MGEKHVFEEEAELKAPSGSGHFGGWGFGPLVLHL